MRGALVAFLCGCGLALWPASSWALGLGVSTPSVTLANFGPGLTATGSGAVVVTGVLAPWVLKASDSANGGRLVPGAVGCSGSEGRTANALTLRATGAIGTTASAGTVTVGAAAVTIANGVVADTVTMNYSLDIGRTEVMRAGCTYSTTVTFTVQ